MNLLSRSNIYLEDTMSSNETKERPTLAELLKKHGIDPEQAEAILAEARPSRREWRKYQCHLTPAQVKAFKEAFDDAELEAIELRIANPTH